MDGIIVILVFLAWIINRNDAGEELILDFKGMNLPAKIFVIAFFLLGCWGLLLNDFWRSPITWNDFILLLNKEYICIVILLLSGGILLENLVRKPLFGFKNPKIKRISFVIICLVIIVVFVGNLILR